MEHDFEANFFTLLELLDAGSRIEIEGACTRSTIPADQVIYQQGQASNAVYIIASGMVEVLTHSPDGKQTRSIANMKKGDFFGDMGVLTGKPRLATVRTCEPTQVLQIEKLMFVRLLDKIPKMGAYFSRNLAKRLNLTFTEADRSVYALDLSGNLQYFDLLTIFQAITGAARSGELRLNNVSNDLIGSFFFCEGRVVYARFAHLEGLEAVWEGFCESAVEGAFHFRIMDKPILPFTEELKIQLESTDLLMQGVTCRDDYLALPESLRRMEGRLSRLGETLAWTDAATQALAERIWELIAKRPQLLDSLWRRFNYSSLHFLTVVSRLVETGQAEVSVDPPAEEKPAPLPRE